VASRSGDPRKRAVHPSPPATEARKRLLVATVVAAAGLVALALFTLRPSDAEPDGEARGHAEAACDLTSKANEATKVSTGARYAAAVLLLDNAIIESERAAEAATEFAALDEAVQALHTAAHRGRPSLWLDALDTALAACDASLR